MLKDVADKVYRKLEANGYEPRLHERADEAGAFDLRLRGHDFDLEDLRRWCGWASESGSR